MADDSEPLHLISALKSSYLTTLIFSYFHSFDGVLCTIKQLSRRGDLFTRANRSQLLAFCVTPPRKEAFTYRMNETCF